MQYQPKCPDELHVIRRKLLVQIRTSKKELQLTHDPAYTAIVKAWIALLKGILHIKEDSSTITEEELKDLVDNKLETKEKALDIAN